MKRPLALLIVVAAACSGQELAPTPTTPPSGPTTTSNVTTTTTPVTTTSSVATTTTTLAPLESLAYEEVALLEFPIHLVGWRDGLSLVATKDGRVWVMEPDGTIGETPVLDISGQVTNQGEQGFLSIAVSPDDPSRVFAHYSGSGGETVVSEFTDQDGLLVDERVLFTHEQPARNHNGGMLQFGSDGGLYLGLGDGGGSNDTFGNGQNLDTLLGGLVRLDPDDPEAEAVLFQYGLRNPWRFWIADDLIYIADVGQNAYEEVSVAPLEQGVNYGWPITEGTHCFRPASGCDTGGLTLPVVEVEHGDTGTCSITGGVVYRGTAIPEIDGQFFYSDYCGGYLRSLAYADGALAEQHDWTDQVGVPGGVASFGVDSSGEMYVLTTDAVYKVVAVRAG